MLCKNPYISGSASVHPCGQCTPCRINKRREWTHRIMLEAMDHGDNVFLTLTYDNDHVPEDGSLEPGELRNFLKRLRKSYGKIRYYAVGEYGDESGRPHYHLALFGYPQCSRGNTRNGGVDGCCSACDMVYRAWGKGGVLLGDLNETSIQYIAGYVLKKMTKPDDERLEGRYPEFARMSLRPGIGSGMMHEVASTILERGLDETLPDVPLGLRHGRRVWPLGRYLRRQLRKRIGRDESAPKAAIEAAEAQVQAMREMASHDYGVKRSVFRELVIRSKDGRRQRLEGRHRVFKRRTQI